MLPSNRGPKDGDETTYKAGVTGDIIEAASWKVTFDDLGPTDVQKLFRLIDQHPDDNLRTLARLILYFGFPESKARAIHWEELDLHVGT